MPAPGRERFTLYFIPPKGKTRDYPPMEPLLCAGAVATLKDNRCATVPGAQALYFGADQPRIVAEALLPWRRSASACRTAAIRRMRTTWYRERWMSLSGSARGVDRPGAG